MKRLILYSVLLSLTVVTGCTSTTTQPDSAASAHARVTENEAKLGIGESVPCLYTYCTSGDRLYWRVFRASAASMQDSKHNLDRVDFAPIFVVQ
jgi:hypothetical protein